MNETTNDFARILVATDLSDQSGLALRRGIELGLEHKAEIIVVHVIDENLPEQARSFLTTTTDHYIRSTLADIPHADKVTVTIDIVVGRPDIDVTERALIEDADLIVAGLHARLLEENLSIEGTIGEQIITATHKPVLIVKNKPRGPYRTVIVAVDFSVYSQAAVRTAMLAAPDADIYLINAYEDDAGINILTRLRDRDVSGKAVTERRRQLEAFVEKEMQALVSQAEVPAHAKNKLHYLSRRGEPHKVLKREAERLGCELIVMGTHGRLGLSRTFAGSVTTQLVNDRLCDALVIKPY